LVEETALKDRSIQYTEIPFTYASALHATNVLSDPSYWDELNLSSSINYSVDNIFDVVKYFNSHFPTKYHDVIRSHAYLINKYLSFYNENNTNYGYKYEFLRQSISIEQDILPSWNNDSERIIRFFITLIIIPFIVSVGANILTPSIEKIIKEIQPKLLNEPQVHKVVLANILNVRNEGSLQAAIIGKIYFGQTVRILKDANGWSLVEHEMMDRNVAIRGWVSSKYLG
jgi:hypothetical protein